MEYFSRRNKYTVEYSGHEEVSPSLRSRLRDVVVAYVKGRNTFSSGLDPLFLYETEFCYEIRKEFPDGNPYAIIAEGKHYEVFTVVEIFLDMISDIDITARDKASSEIYNAFKLSGSVYVVRGKEIGLSIEEDLAKKIEEAKPIFSPYEEWHQLLFEAIGDLVARRTKSSNVVKDIYIATEGYLKEKTGKKDYSEAVKDLARKGILNKDQQAVLGRLFAYRSNTQETSHAGELPPPTEADALWFLETMLAQIRHIDKKLRDSQAIK